MASTMWTMLAVEGGTAFAIAASLAVWARHGFRLPQRGQATK